MDGSRLPISYPKEYTDKLIIGLVCFDIVGFVFVLISWYVFGCPTLAKVVESLTAFLGR